MVLGNLNCGLLQEPGVAPSEALIPGLHEYTWMLEGYNLCVVYLHGMAWYSVVL